ncbi:hypothetical protein BCV70DRAFT_203190 [Testicularia cyperi]|uniref:RRM domain-containing protein n=1 Tax=Testicularia cyperi TaxID=1882483 RepID=A0A317XGT8_9BASI|nr:hypothetical protein BCV70DRAFT_203190 [Testicularia cyperi]
MPPKKATAAATKAKSAASAPKTKSAAPAAKETKKAASTSQKKAAASKAEQPATSSTSRSSRSNGAGAEKKAAPSNGKKRAAPATAEPAAKKPRAKKAAVPEPEVDEASSANDDGVLDERDVIAALSDVSDVDDDDDDEEAQEEEEEEDDDEGNSSDEDEEDDRLAQRSSMASIKLPNSKDDAAVQKRLEKVKKAKKAGKSASTPATLYVGRLPKGFFEDQMKAYFAQFGDVTRIRVSRNKKTGASKHYAFVEFADQDVAQIVQETMNNYLIDGRLLQVKVVPKDKIHPEMWIGANRKYRPIPVDRLERLNRSQPRTEEQQESAIQRTLDRQDKRRKKLADAGIDYDFEGYTREGAQSPPKKAKTVASAAVSAAATPAKATPAKKAAKAAGTPAKNTPVKKATTSATATPAKRTKKASA